MAAAMAGRAGGMRGGARGPARVRAGKARATAAANGRRGSERRRAPPAAAYPASSLANLPALADATPVAINAGLVGATLVASYVWVKLFDVLASREVFERKLSRKLVHITTGPLFLATWPLYATGTGAALGGGALSDLLVRHPETVVCAVPLVNLIRLALIGFGVVPSKNTLRAVSRSGDRKELLRGPLFYSLCITVIVAVFWRESPTALVAISVLCIGDGLADVVGRRLGKGNPLPFNAGKSYAGSTAMFLGGWLGSLVFVQFFMGTCGLHVALPEDSFVEFALRSALVCFLATVVEALPANAVVDDNISVPISTILICKLLQMA